ncbi:hypothetical protein EV702DRAFT_1282681 [Suillus placidus]|uniref:Nephrocystin 3-like N-terminal domain-containing protein n=1 Tax=Suillus placidus TaxID=48579 RepID=A0A9P6ZI10_9AGAM|nr:hypothetical protein EV702DRAFT_1282681 [Suillus placidus]
MNPAYNAAWRSLCKVVNYSAIFDSEMRQPHSRCMENTRVALQETLRQVLDRHDRTNIWLKGLAGVGKTSIAFTVAEEMKLTQRLAASFFFSRQHAQHATMIIPTIAYQLALVFPSIKDAIMKAIAEDELLLSSGKSRCDQMQELIVKPLHPVQFQAARLVKLLTESFSGPDLPNIHLLFTSRPQLHIRAAMQTDIHEIPLITGDDATLRDVRVFLRVSLDNIRKTRPDHFGQPLMPWPSEHEFETLVSNAGGLFVYAALVISFISAAGHPPQQRLNHLLRESSVVNADIDQLYRHILASSENPIVHCQMLTCITHLDRPLSLANLQDLFFDDKESLAMMLEAFSPVILNLPRRNVEIYHTSLFDFMENPTRSKQYYVDRARAHEYLARCCLKSLMRKSPMIDDYAFGLWHYHLSLAYPSSELRNVLALFTEKELRRLVVFAERGGASSHLVGPLHSARQTCLSFKWIRSFSDIKVAWRIAKASRKVDEVHITSLRRYRVARPNARPMPTRASSQYRQGSSTALPNQLASAGQMQPSQTQPAPQPMAVNGASYHFDINMGCAGHWTLFIL